MKKLPKNIEDLFYNPKKDSISFLIKKIIKIHKGILTMTDFSKSTVQQSQKNNIPEFTIPDSSNSSEKMDDLIAELYNGTPRWNSPNTMYNVAPPPILATVITKTFTALYNPNLVLKTASGGSLLTEKKVICGIADFIGWRNENYDGIFTFGGKATTIYGIKIGLKKCSVNSPRNGVKEDIIIFSTKSGHPSHISDAEWLGIGADNVTRINTDDEGRINLNELENNILQTTKENKKIATIIISGGTTNSMIVDPIKEVVELRDRLVRELNLTYTPHIHVDAVVGFPWIFFKEYNMNSNNLNLSKNALLRISNIIKDLKNLHMADSFGIDFHKMGFCPYISSLFMIKDKAEFSGLGNSNSPFVYSIENSRSGDGPNSAYISLNVLGVQGYQILIAHLTETAIDLEYQLEKSKKFFVMNKTGIGISVLFSPHLPENVELNQDLELETKIRNAYNSRFITKISELNNPFYIDKIPGNSTGANPYPFVVLKAYLMSPFSNKKSNSEFVSFLVKLKHIIDSEFDFKNIINTEDSNSNHPLK